MADIKHVPPRVVIGPHGPCVTEGYTEIAGVRFYPERVVVGPHGPVVVPPRTTLEDHNG